MKEGTIQEKTFNAHVKEWEKLGTESGKASSQADEYYDEHILPDVKEKFTENYRSEQKYDGLILTVGGSPEPVILSICAIQSERVGLICNKGRKESIDRIVKGTDLVASDLVAGAREVDGSNTIEIYKAIMDFYAKWGKPEKIALGITGGTKVMSSSAAMAGAILGADIYYVATEAKNILNKPVPRKEYLHLVANPYTVFGDFEADKASQLFRRHDYAGAQSVFKELTQIGAPQKRIIYEAHALLCEVYDAWDNFNVQHAFNKLGNLLDYLTKFTGLSMLTELEDFHKAKPSLEKQKESLDRLRSFVNNERGPQGLPCDKSDRFHFAFTLYHSALRRSEQGKYDLACLLLYRLLEWIGQCRLDQYNIDTDASTHDYRAAGQLCTPKKTKEQISERYTKKSEEVGSSDSSAKTSLPAERITLVDMYLLLHALGDDLIKEFHWEKFNNGIETRNKSVYIHGRRVVNKQGFYGFHGTLNDIFEKAQKLEGIDASEFTEQHKFIVL